MPGQPVRVHGPGSYEGHVSSVSAISSFVNEVSSIKVTETVAWSQVRYTGYSLLVMDSRPGAWRGAASTLTVRGLAEDGTEIDRITLAA